MAAWGKWTILIIVILALMVCCCLVIVLAGGGFAAYKLWEEVGFTPDVHETVEIYRGAVSENAILTLATLENSEIPENDLTELAVRLEGREEMPRTLDTPAGPYEVGDVKSFWVSDTDTNENFQVSARLSYITPSAYFWVQEGVEVNQSELKELAETFDQEIYPRVRSVFGSEWSPGVDLDEHLYILYARGLGSGIAGYFSSRDSTHPEMVEYSNGHEMFLFNVDTVDLDEEFTYGVLAHEFQHMIHWYVDRNESTWLNEGFSELASFLCGYDPGGFDWYFMKNPDRQLTYWPGGDEDSSANYGGSFLFVNYFYDRFGEEATKAWISHEENGMESLDLVFEELGLADGVSGELLTADDFFMDWAVANYLGDTRIADGRYGYTLYTDAPQAWATEQLYECTGEWQERVVNQYGVDYIGLECEGRYRLEVEGATEVSVLPVETYEGDWMWWSNRGDESDMTLTREFDLSGVIGEVRLVYQTWYDLEADYDYVYVEASLDGEQWEILKTPGGTGEDPSGNSYGWGYNGESGGWVEEWVDLSAYAGGQVWIRYEYVTDAAVNGEGFALDEIRLEAIGYEEGFEEGEGGWEGEGFVRIGSRIPQTYGLRLVKEGAGGIQVEQIEMDEMNGWVGEVEIGGGGSDRLVLVIAGQSRYTNQLAGYRFRLVPVDEGSALMELGRTNE